MLIILVRQRTIWKMRCKREDVRGKREEGWGMIIFFLFLLVSGEMTTFVAIFLLFTH